MPELSSAGDIIASHRHHSLAALNAFLGICDDDHIRCSDCVAPFFSHLRPAFGVRETGTILRIVTSPQRFKVVLCDCLTNQSTPFETSQCSLMISMFIDEMHSGSGFSGTRSMTTSLSAAKVGNIMSFHQETTYAEPHPERAHAPDRLYHDAVHEAARIAIGRVLGLPSGYAVPVPEYESPTSSHRFAFNAVQASEWNRLHPGRNGDDRAFWRRTIIMDMACAEAEREIIGSSAHEQADPHCIFGHSDDQPVRSARMHQLARRLVKRHRDAILRLADQLIAADELGELLAR
jgi:hypothetical protein